MGTLPFTSQKEGSFPFFSIEPDSVLNNFRREPVSFLYKLVDLFIQQLSPVVFIFVSNGQSGLRAWANTSFEDGQVPKKPNSTVEGRC